MGEEGNEHELQRKMKYFTLRTRYEATKCGVFLVCWFVGEREGRRNGLRNETKHNKDDTQQQRNWGSSRWPTGN